MWWDFLNKTLECIIMIGENGVSCQNVFIIVIYTTQNACFVDLLYVAFKQRKSELQYPFIIFLF